MYESSNCNVKIVADAATRDAAEVNSSYDNLYDA